MFHESLRQTIPHNIRPLLGEMHIVFTGITVLHPRLHRVPTSHSVIYAPIGGTVLVGHLSQPFNDVGKETIRLPNSFTRRSHVRRPNEEYCGFRATVMEVVDLLSQLFAISLKSLLPTYIRHGITAKMKYDKRHIHLLISAGEELRLDALELMT